MATACGGGAEPEPLRTDDGEGSTTAFHGGASTSSPAEPAEATPALVVGPGASSSVPSGGVTLATGAASGETSATAAGSTGATAGAGGADGGTCQVVAESYDRTCEQDSDCVLVPPGGNVCDPCSAGSGAFWCNLAAVNGKVSAAYLADLQAALAPLEGGAQINVCVISSCPTGGVPKCDHGTCTSSR